MSKFLSKVLLPLASLALSVASANSQPLPPPPQQVEPPSRQSLPLSAASPGAEQWERFLDQVTVRNVTAPTLYPVLPRAERSNGRAVIIVPGGGYQFVSIDSEGFRVADALAADGYAAFVLKYRTLATPRDTAAYMAAMAQLFGNLGKAKIADDPEAVSDLAAAVKLVRNDAAKYHVDPHKIGVIGFSAGARTSIRLLEEKPEALSLENVALIYPPMTNPVKSGPRPPLFMAIASDDPLFRQGGLALLDSWIKESPKVEFHLYSGGSHGFGMRPQGTTSDLWITQYETWLVRH